MKEGYKMPISKAQQKAVAKYNAKAYDRIDLRIKKGCKSQLQAHAEKQGESINGFIKKAIKTQYKNDTGDDIEL